jgi:phospholipid/cholesterol/gamma-HCH transport system substrate-binding protein
MEGRVNYTTVGIFVVALTTFLFSVIIWMSVVGQGRLYHTYIVYVREDVTGLSEENPVRFNGVKVGYVDSIRLDEKNPKLVKLVLRIQPGVPVTTSTYAILNAQGITGVVYVNLKADSENPTLLTALPDHRYPIIPSRPSLLVQLSETLPEMTHDIQKLTSSVGQILDDQNRESIKTTLKNVATLSKTLADNSRDFTDTLHYLDNTMANISAVSDHLPSMVNQVNKTLVSVDQLSVGMNQTSKSIQDTMKSGQIVIHHFSSEVIPNAQQALSNLSTATMGVAQLTGQLQRDPSMLIRGKQPAPPGPGEK